MPEPKDNPKDNPEHIAQLRARWKGKEEIINAIIEDARKGPDIDWTIRLAKADLPFLNEVPPGTLYDKYGNPTVPTKYGKDLRGIGLREKGLENTWFAATDFRYARLGEVWLGNSVLSYADFSLADLERANMIRADLTGALLAGASLSKAHLDHAVLINADLTDSECLDATLDQTTLNGAILRNTQLENASLKDASLSAADLRGANLAGADLDGASLIKAKLKGLVLNPKTSLRYKARWWHCFNSQRMTFDEYDAFRNDRVIRYLWLFFLRLSFALLRFLRSRFLPRSPAPNTADGGEAEDRPLRGSRTLDTAEDYDQAVNVYGQLAQAYKNNGHHALAAWASYRKRVCERKAAYPWRGGKGLRTWLSRTLSWLILDRTCGYGERPFRIVVSALVVVLGSAFLYCLSNQSLCCPNRDRGSSPASAPPTQAHLGQPKAGAAGAANCVEARDATTSPTGVVTAFLQGEHFAKPQYAQKVEEAPSTESTEPGVHCGSWRQRGWDNLYFSMVTFATLGLGDFQPSHVNGRDSVCLECVVAGEGIAGAILMALAASIFFKRLTRS